MRVIQDTCTTVKVDSGELSFGDTTQTNPSCQNRYAFTDLGGGRDYGNYPLPLNFDIDDMKLSKFEEKKGS